MGLVSRVERNVAAKDTSAVILESLVGWFCSTARLEYRWGGWLVGWCVN